MMTLISKIRRHRVLAAVKLMEHPVKRTSSVEAYRFGNAPVHFHASQDT